MEQSTLMIVSALIAGIVCLGLGILLGIVLRRRIAEAKIGSAEEEAKRIVEAAKKQGEFEPFEPSRPFAACAPL